MFQFHLSHTTQCFIMIIHTYIFRLVEPAEHTDLRKFCHSRKQHKPQVFISPFEGGIESFQDFAVGIFQRSIQCIENRLVIFIYQYHGTMPRLLIG